MVFIVLIMCWGITVKLLCSICWEDIFTGCGVTGVSSGITMCVFLGVWFLQVLLLMGSVKWDIKEIRSQHSNYVDRLLQVLLGMQHFPIFVGKI